MPLSGSRDCVIGEGLADASEVVGSVHLIVPIKSFAQCYSGCSGQGSSRRIHLGLPAPSSPRLWLAGRTSAGSAGEEELAAEEGWRSRPRVPIWVAYIAREVRPQLLVFHIDSGDHRSGHIFQE